MNVTLKSYMVLFVAKNRQFLQMLSPDTRAMGHFVDVVWFDLGDTFAMGHSCVKYYKLKKGITSAHLTLLFAIRLWNWFFLTIVRVI